MTPRRLLSAAVLALPSLALFAGCGGSPPEVDEAEVQVKAPTTAPAAAPAEPGATPAPPPAPAAEPAKPGA